jgi:CheY-like chemotaxis protein
LELDEPRVKWAQQVIETQVARLSHMVDDLLDVSRIAHGKISLKLEDIELNSLLTQIMQSIVTLAEQKRQQLSISLPEHEVRLKGDSIRLSQAIFNLLDNAIKYTPDGGLIEFTARMAGEEVEIGVQDNGMGITAELLPKVFDLFQQDERGLDRAQGGLGIGLTLVQRLVVKHGGRVAAYSKGKGMGATFTVWLPAWVATTQPAEKATMSKRSATQGRRVLVVDDDFAVADSTAMLLELEGYAVCVANSGAAALGKVPIFRPQAVLLDIGLHGMDGFEVAKRLRELPEGRDLFVVAVTGYADEKTRARALASGCDRFLVKPVAFDVLDGLLDEALGDVTQHILPPQLFTARD